MDTSLIGVGLVVFSIYQNNKSRLRSKVSPPVYKITLENERGSIRQAWAVCGEGRPRLNKLNPDPDLVIVVWDDEYKEGYSRRI